MTAETRMQSEAGEAPDGVDLVALAGYLPRFLPTAEAPLSAELISGGRSNLTYYLRSRASGEEWVLRRPPLGHVLPTAHDTAREYRVISALAGTGVPVPGTYLLCEDPAIIGAPFYVMERVYGEIVHSEMPLDLAPTPIDRRRMCEAFVDALVRLHAIDPEAVGLGDFGRPQGFMGRQLRRWGEQWQRSKTFESPELEELQRRLQAALPESPPATILHGDYRLENMIFGVRRPDTIRAMLDWEMATLGDPFADLGYALAYWVQDGDSELRQRVLDMGVVSMAEGFMTRAELAEEYGRRSGRAMGGVDFYFCFGLYKLSVIVQGIVARNLAGETRGGGFEEYDEDRVRGLIALAWEAANGSSDALLRGER
jgi:aminoglycoside phosphotransferase (APT) family kinase protein